MSLPNPGMDAVPFTPLTAEFLDDMIENIESLSDGTGIESGATFDAPNFRNWSGWIDANESWTYSSYDSTNKTGVITVPTNATTKYSLGMRVRFTNNSTTQYGIITKISTTTLTVYFGTDYSLTNSSITVPYYSSVKGPFGFPLDPTKWRVVASSVSDRVVSSTTLTSLTDKITAPIGVWKAYFKAHLQVNSTQAASRRTAVTLSADGATETNPQLTLSVGQVAATSTSTTTEAGGSASDTVVVTTPTDLLMMGRLTSSTNASGGVLGSVNSTRMELVCGYL